MHPTRRLAFHAAKKTGKALGRNKSLPANFSAIGYSLSVQYRKGCGTVAPLLLSHDTLPPIAHVSPRLTHQCHRCGFGIAPESFPLPKCDATRHRRPAATCLDSAAAELVHEITHRH